MMDSDGEENILVNNLLAIIIKEQFNNNYIDSNLEYDKNLDLEISLKNIKNIENLLIKFYFWNK